MSQIPGIKANIENVPKTVLPILDAEGYAICPDCDSRVNCGTIGLANLEKHHHGKKICKAVQWKRDKEVKKKKDGNILSFLKPYHLQCVELELEPRNWVCVACEASGRGCGGKRQ